MNPSNFNPIMNLARLEAGRGNRAEALTYLQTAEERFDVIMGLGFIAHGYALAGQRDKAIELATRARANGSGGAGFEALLSLILGEREEGGRVPRAIRGPSAPLVPRNDANKVQRLARSRPERSGVRGGSRENLFCGVAERLPMDKSSRLISVISS